MHKSPAISTVLTFCTIALAGCASETLTDATPDPETVTVQPRPEPSVEFPTDTPAEGSEPVPSPSMENAWAEKQLRDYMTYQGANSLKGFSKGSPERNIIAVTNPEDGVVRFEVRDLDYEADGWALEGLAVNFMLYTGCAADDVDSVIVQKAGDGERVVQDHC